MMELKVKSAAFEHNTPIPKKYSCDGEDINPPLTIEGIPKEAKTLTLILEDPDAPSGIFDHWVVWNIPAAKGEIGENTHPGVEGMNSLRQKGYQVPAHPMEHTGTSLKPMR
jgi:Raf kinase inhibitor-like YbhB/YbcL family protein